MAKRWFLLDDAPRRWILPGTLERPPMLMAAREVGALPDPESAHVGELVWFEEQTYVLGAVARRESGEAEPR